MCNLLDRQAEIHGWSQHQLEAKLAEHRAEQRELQARAQAQVQAEWAAKSPEQAAAEFEAEAKLREEVEPEIEAPPVMERLYQSEGLLRFEDINEIEQAEVRQYRDAKNWALPRGVPPLSGSYVFPCSVISDGAGGEKKCIGFMPQGQMLGMAFGADITWLTGNPWPAISAINIEGPQEAERRVTAPRAAAFGIFSLAMKKERRRAFLLVERHDQEALLCRIEGITPLELRAKLAPMLAWFEQYRARLNALYRLNGSHAVVPPLAIQSRGQRPQ